MIQIGPRDGEAGSKQGFGFFSTAVYDDDTGDFLGCIDFSSQLKEQASDLGFKLSRAFSGLLGAFITFATMICLLVQCFNKHGKSCLWSYMKWSYVGAFLCQGASFVIWHTDLCKEIDGEPAHCSIGWDGVASVINGVLLFGMVFSTFNSSPPRNPVFRCWHATDGDFETDSEYSEENVTKHIDVDVESQQTKSVAQSSRRNSSRSIPSSSRSVRDDGSVSLFSSKSWLSNPQKLTVKQHARRLEKKKANIWPMNQLNPQWPTRDYQGAPKKFVPLPETTAVEPYKSANLATWKKSESKTATPAIDTTTGLPKTGLVPASAAEMYLKQIRARQQANGVNETIVVATGKKKTNKEEQPVIAKKNTITSSTSGSKKSVSSRDSASKQKEATDVQAVERLGMTVVLKKGGSRIEKSMIGTTLKIVDEYPSDCKSVSSDASKSTRMVTDAGIVDVRTEYCVGGRKTTMEETRSDGRLVITTLIDPLTMEEELNGL